MKKKKNGLKQRGEPRSRAGKMRCDGEVKAQRPVKELKKRKSLVKVKKKKRDSKCFPKAGEKIGPRRLNRPLITGGHHVQVQKK